MIKYPVRVRVPDYDNGKYSISDSNGFVIVDSSDNDITLCQNKENANTIANALNAMNEFPGIFDETPVEISAWAKKHNL